MLRQSPVWLRPTGTSSNSKAILGNRSFRDPQYVTKCWLNAAALRFDDNLKQTLHRVCPLHWGSCKVSRPYYWEGEADICFGSFAVACQMID